MDYNEIFSPVVEYCAIRSLLALANANDLDIHQMDVKTAFPNGSIDSKKYMKQTEGYVDAERQDFVGKLKKASTGSSNWLDVGILLLISILYHLAITRATLMDAFTSN